MSTVSIRLPDDISDRLDQLSRLTGRAKTDCIVEAISKHLDDLEDAYLAEQALIRIRSGEDDRISLEQAMAEYRLDRRT